MTGGLRVNKTPQSIAGTHSPNISDIGEVKREVCRAHRILKDNTHLTWSP